MTLPVFLLHTSPQPVWLPARFSNAPSACLWTSAPAELIVENARPPSLHLVDSYYCLGFLLGIPNPPMKYSPVLPVSAKSSKDSVTVPLIFLCSIHKNDKHVFVHMIIGLRPVFCMEMLLALCLFTALSPEPSILLRKVFKHPLSKPTLSQLYCVYTHVCMWGVCVCRVS